MARQKKQPISTGYQVTIGFKNKREMNNFMEDFQMSKDESVKRGAKAAISDIKQGKTTSLSDFIKRHGV